ncbi:MAG: DUF2334 domain-containing protein [Nitrospira sp.]|nr:DUF2334 domain-containing protein [Nitrospira sp.]
MQFISKFNRKNLFCILILVSIVSCGNSNNEPNATSSVSLENANNFRVLLNSPNELLCNQSTNISVKVYTNISKAIKHDLYNFQYKWTANAGEIIGEGPNITYIAPENENLAYINIKVIDDYGNSIVKSAPIVIHKQYIIIKADDLGDILHEKWQNFINYLENNDIKASIGIIAKYLTYSNTKWFNNVKLLIEKGNIEFFCHGLDHSKGTYPDGQLYWEFKNTPFEQQKDHLTQCENLAKEKLNITFYTFGAPYSTFDDNTRMALEEIEEIKVWFFGDQNSKKFVLNNTVNTETDQHPNFEQFVSQYNKDSNYIILRFHPGSWVNNDFIEFRKIIEYLMKQEIKFITPFEYYKILQKL